MTGEGPARGQAVFWPCCEHCGAPLRDGGVAFLCGPKGGGSLQLPPYCPDVECRRVREDDAIMRAAAAGVIDP